MKLELVHWQFHNFNIGMIAINPGELYCTTTTLAAAFGIPTSMLRQNYQNNKEALSPLSLSYVQSKDAEPLSVDLIGAKERSIADFVRDNKEVLGVKRIRQDMLLWSEDDIIEMSALCRSPIAREFRRMVNQICKSHVVKNCITMEQYNLLHLQNLSLVEKQSEANQKIAGLTKELSDLKQMFSSFAEAANTSASLAGEQLRCHRTTKQYLDYSQILVQDA